MKNMYPIVWSKLGLHKPNGTNNYFQDGQGKKIQLLAISSSSTSLRLAPFVGPAQFICQRWFLMICRYPVTFPKHSPRRFPSDGIFFSWLSLFADRRAVRAGLELFNCICLSSWQWRFNQRTWAAMSYCIYALLPFHPISSFIEFWFCLVLHLQLLWLTRVSNNRGIIAFPALCASAERWYSLCVSDHVLSIWIFN